MATALTCRFDTPESFSEAGSALFAPLRVTDPRTAFRVTVDPAAVGPVVAARIQASPATVVRDRALITSTDPEWMKLTLLHNGPVGIAQGDRMTRLKPGDLFACDTTRPYRLTGIGASDMTVFCVPRTSLGRHADTISRRTALPISTQAGIGRLLGQLIGGVQSMDSELPGHGAAGLYVADALTALLLAAFADTTPERVCVGSDFIDRIRVYVLANLGDPLLSAERVARQHNISVRYLYTLFQGQDLTFAAWVRHERLLRIRRDLLDPAFDDRSTAAIAARWGILDAKHLGRALKSEFGVTATELRRKSAGG